MTGQSPKALHDTTMLAVSGMTCSGCASTVTRILARVPGVEDASVDFETGRATVSGTAPPAALIDALSSADYRAELVATPEPEQSNARD